MNLPSLNPVRLLLPFLFIFCSFGASATHIVGGDLGYRYLGETAPGTGEYRYKLILRLFVNCGPSSSFPSVIDIVGSPTGGLPVGVYSDDPTAPNANKTMLTSGLVYVTSYGVITPDLADDCSLGDGQCVEESRLEGEVVLSASPTGFHLYLQLFARNQSIDNLVDPGGTGMGFYSYIPPTAIVNSSPVFTGTPVPYICISDTTAFSNAAIDSDGDSLVFSFETPYASQDDVGGVATPPAILQWPLQPVQFLGGSSPTAPFGAAGFASIDAATGATQYSTTMIGNWVVAVEVKEYRNGQLIGLIRSDLQLLSVPCSGTNVAPMPLNGELTTSYQVVAGEQLCFPLDFVDVDGDLLTIGVIGGIFESTITDPPAALTGPITGDSLLSSLFCWTTACDQGSSDVYHFSVLVYDDACPPGTYSATITIEVVPSFAPPSISGLGIGCSGQTTTEYCTELVENATYNWTVTGGTIESEQDGPCITIAWGAPGIGQITVERIMDGCSMETVQPINILTTPPAEFTITTDTTCLGIRALAFDTSPNTVGSTWFVNGVETTVGQNGPEFLLPFNQANVIGLQTTTNTGCVGYTEQTVMVAPYGELVHFELPNVFTPNKDNVNDRFKLKTTQTLDPCFIVQIFDRWGKLVHEGDGGNNGWNGTTLQGEPASEGVYFYIVTLNHETFHGHVSLMR
ncbi:MAG: gliding motility-associated C-terminal domain-containing protein [Flavobacteriales bacterium]|nr:gliding motility-associated C-terminal domain-containing protein [Flavobacteriales bacterium]